MFMFIQQCTAIAILTIRLNIEIAEIEGTIITWKTAKFTEQNVTVSQYNNWT